MLAVAKRNLLEDYPPHAIKVLAQYLEITHVRSYDDLCSQIVELVFNRHALKGRLRGNHCKGRMTAVNDLEALFFLYPHRNWNYEALAENPNLTYAMISIENGNGWDDLWELIVENEAMTLDIIEAHPDFEWNLWNLSANPNITPDFVRRHPEIQWHYEYMGLNKNLTHDFIEEHLDKMSYDLLSQNPVITWKFIQEHPSLYWNYSYISANPSITPVIVDSNSDFSWDWFWLSKNKNITIKFIQKHLNKPWNWSELSKNSALTWNDIKSQLDIEMFRSQSNIQNRFSEWKWNWIGISSNPNITPKIVNDHPYFPWFWGTLSFNLNTTIEFVKQHLDKDWDWEALSRHHNIIWEDIQKNQGPGWDWNIENVSLNPNLTWKIVKDNPNFLWDWNNLSINKFKHGRAASQIQRFYRERVQPRIRRQEQERQERARCVSQGFLQEWYAPGAPGYEEVREDWYSRA